MHPNPSEALIELRRLIEPLIKQGEDRIWRPAEKALALIDTLQSQLATAREAERAAVVGWLRSNAEEHRKLQLCEDGFAMKLSWADRADALQLAAEQIQSGDHIPTGAE